MFFFYFHISFSNCTDNLSGLCCKFTLLVLISGYSLFLLSFYVYTGGWEWNGWSTQDVGPWMRLLVCQSRFLCSVQLLREKLDKKEFESEKSKHRRSFADDGRPVQRIGHNLNRSKRKTCRCIMIHRTLGRSMTGGRSRFENAIGSLFSNNFSPIVIVLLF